MVPTSSFLLLLLELVRILPFTIVSMMMMMDTKVFFVQSFVSIKQQQQFQLSLTLPLQRSHYCCYTNNGKWCDSDKSTIARGNSRGLSLTSTSLCFSLKPAAIPLMDSGKAFARSGEYFIEMTRKICNGVYYGGSLSTIGVQIRNAGDSIAQAGASCRFKTGYEYVSNELRESATCLQEAVERIGNAILEIQQQEDTVTTQSTSKVKRKDEGTVMPFSDNDDDCYSTERSRLLLMLNAMMPLVQECSTSLEAAGERIMKQQSSSTSTQTIGAHLLTTSNAMRQMSNTILQLLLIMDTEATAVAATTTTAADTEIQLASERMKISSELMKIAATELTGLRLNQSSQPKDRSFLKQQQAGGGSNS